MSGRYSGPSAYAMAHRLRHIGARALARPESDPVRALGLTWYDRARDWCAALAEEYREHGATLERVAGAVAALSPQTSWLDQCRFVPGFVASVLVERDEESLPHPGFLRNRRKAARILLGDDPARVLSGPKVTAFFAGIMGATDIVTIDRHAATLALGARTPTFSERAAAEMREAYALAARWLGVAPRNLQSLLWCDYKARGAAVEHEAPTLFEELANGAPSIVDLALGFAPDPAVAFHAPADRIPDTRAPLAPGFEQAAATEAAEAFHAAQREIPF